MVTDIAIIEDTLPTPPVDIVTMIMGTTVMDTETDIGMVTMVTVTIVEVVTMTIAIAMKMVTIVIAIVMAMAMIDQGNKVTDTK